MFRNIYFLSRFNAKILLKNRTTPLLLSISFASVVISLLLADINISIKHKLFEDILLISQGYILLFCSIFYTYELILRDRLKGLFVIPLSLGVSRGEYLISIFISPALLVVSMFFGFLVIDIVFLLFIEDGLYLPLLYQLYFHLLSALLVGFFIVMFSNFVSLLNSLTYSFVIYLIGQGLDELYIYFDGHIFSKILYFCFPNF